MRTIIFKDLTNNQILDILDPSIPYIFIPNFRPRSAREWLTTSFNLNSEEKLENIEIRDLTVDIMTNRNVVEQILKGEGFNQISLWQFSKRIPQTLKIDELPIDTIDNILIQNGLVNKIWINYEFVELSSNDDKYLLAINEKFKTNLA